MLRREFIRASAGLALILAGCGSSNPNVSRKTRTKIIHPRFFPSPDLNEESLMNGYDLVLFDVNSGQERRITNNKQGDGFPIFSKDGKSAFLARFDGNLNSGSRFIKINLEDLSEQEISLKDMNFRGEKIKNTNLPGFPLSSWTNDNEIVVDDWLGGLAFALSDNNSNFNSNDGRIHTINLGKNTADNLFEVPGNYSFSRISPDGKRIAFSSIDKVGSGGVINLYVCNVDGTKKERLTDFKDISRFTGKAKEKDREWLRGMALTPSWSPAGEEIAYISGITGNFEIFKVNLENGKTTQLTSREEESWLPIWARDGIYFIKKQNGLYKSEETDFFVKAMKKNQHFNVEDMMGKREIWRIDGNGNGERKIVDTTDIYYGTFDAFSY
jgi:hypothetical protein